MGLKCWMSENDRSSGYGTWSVAYPRVSANQIIALAVECHELRVDPDSRAGVADRSRAAPSFVFSSSPEADRIKGHGPPHNSNAIHPLQQ